jgi:hypothetical protein
MILKCIEWSIMKLIMTATYNTTMMYEQRKAEDVKVRWSQEERLLQLAPVGTQYVIGVIRLHFMVVRRLYTLLHALA